MVKFNFEFQFLVSLASGLFLGMLSYGLLFTVFFVLIFEIFVFCYGTWNPPAEDVTSRGILNIGFFIGWMISRTLFLRETGFECISNTIEGFWRS